MKKLDVDLGAGLQCAFVIHEDGSEDIELQIAHMTIDLRRLLAALPPTHSYVERTNEDTSTLRTVRLDEHDRLRLRLLRKWMTNR